MTSRLSTASNAELTVNGVAVERSTNVIDDVVTGMTRCWAGATASTSVISVARDLTGVDTRIRALVDAYNVMETPFDNLSDADSTEELGGIFQGHKFSCDQRPGEGPVPRRLLHRHIEPVLPERHRDNV